MEPEKRTPDYSNGNKLVVSNRYIQAIHPDRMSLNAMKLFRLAITQCRMNDDNFYEYDFQIHDCASVMKIDESNMYREIQNMCLNLMQMVLKVGTGDAKDDWELKHIFEVCKYTRKTGTVSILLHRDMTELFLQLKTNFTRIPIINILSMKSKYAIRIYELICEKMMSHYPYADETAELTLSLEDVRKATGTDKKKTYNKISNFKNIVWNPSIREIEQVANWKIIVEEIKCGRIISGFKLTIWSIYGYQYGKRTSEGKETAGRNEQLDHVQMSIFDYDI